jgi:hypothetical protein
VLEAFLRPDDAPDAVGDFEVATSWEPTADLGLIYLRLILALAACNALPLLLCEGTPLA